MTIIAHPKNKKQEAAIEAILTALDVSFQKEVQRILDDYSCVLEIRRFKPIDTPAIFTKMEQNNVENTISQLKENVCCVSTKKRKRRSMGISFHKRSGSAKSLTSSAPI